MEKNSLLPGNSYFARTNAPMDAIIRCPAVPTTVINTVLNMYLEKVTHDFPIVTNKSWKLSIVGFCANTFGGNKNSSSNGFKALLTAKTSGNTMASAIKNNRK